jgi:hypothetical protein
VNLKKKGLFWLMVSVHGHFACGKEKHHSKEGLEEDS